MEHAFGRGESLALGVEEELLLVDPDTLALAHRVSELLPRLGDAVKPDVYEAEVETASPICRDGLEAAAALGAVRERLREAGATLIGCGIHPDAPFGEAPHVPGERYAAIADSMRGFMRRTPTCALHVHVGMPDPESAIRACTGLRSYLPVLQGLAAHSPYWHGLDSGFASARAQLFRAFPRAVIPPAFADWAAYEAYVAAWLEAGDAPDYTFLWWDIRPHPRLGTRRVPRDGRAGPARLRRGPGGARARARARRRSTAAPTRPSRARRSPRARSGPAATGSTRPLRWDGAMRPLRDLAAEAIGHARGALRERGADGALEHVERILREGNGADAMRAAHAQRRDARGARAARRGRGSGRLRRGAPGDRRDERHARRTTPRSSARSPASGSQLWETPSASELLSACSTMHGSSDPVRW